MTFKVVDISHTMPVLNMEGVVLKYGEGQSQVVALDGVSLAVAAGEVIVIWGESGAGKTSLLQVAGCLQKPTLGDVLIDGCDVVGMSEKRRADLRRRRVGYVFQDYNLLDILSSEENVALPLELDGMRDAREQARKVLTELDIETLATRFPAEMSGGQRQRVAIARALLGPRRLLIADEPTGSLDSDTSRLVRNALIARARVHGVGVLVGTHDPEWFPLADRVLQMNDGALTASRESR